MIQVENLTKGFDGLRALDGLCLTVPDGCVYGLVGPNGAGKTTVIRHLTGVYRQDSGAVFIDGQRVYENPAVKQRIACIPDELYACGSETIHDMMRFYRRLYPRFDEARFRQLGEVFALDEKRPFRRFSKGMQKQAAFWLAISCRPDYLILDEPVDGLDPVMRRQVWSLVMEDVSANGTSVLISSHNLRELEDVCDHVGIMHHGKMMLERSLDALQENIVKAQLVTDQPLPEGLTILHQSQLGRIQTLILRGKQDEVAAQLALCHPMLCDLLPLSLEEIFIYELGGADYDVKNIVL